MFMLSKIANVLECSRVFSLPMTIMSWLVVFTFSIFQGGNTVYGIIALLGICFAHLAANVFDDYFDYKALIQQVGFDRKKYLQNSQKTKCRYIVSGRMKENEVLALALFYSLIACAFGLFFYLKCGIGVIYFALAGGLIAFTYSLLSKIRLSEIAVALAYGPALYGGVYYVMTKTYSPEVFALSMPTMFVTVILLYIHTVMDFDFDLNEGHNTLANLFDSQLDALVILKFLMVFAYISPVFLCIFDILDWQIFFVYMTIPLAVDLYKSMVDYSTNPESIPEHKWYHFPMENMLGAPNFMIRMYQSRNLMIYYSIILAFAIILCQI